jgi:hypothetical protein
MTTTMSKSSKLWEGVNFIVKVFVQIFGINFRITTEILKKIGSEEFSGSEKAVWQLFLPESE